MLHIVHNRIFVAAPLPAPSFTLAGFCRAAPQMYGQAAGSGAGDAVPLDVAGAAQLGALRQQLFSRDERIVELQVPAL